MLTMYSYLWQKLVIMSKMNIIESIKKRRSVRTYTGEPLDASTIEKITEYVNGLKPPFGVKCRVELLQTNTGTEPVKLGTYGFIKGASTFIALVPEDGPLAEEGAAYMFEQVVLHCTALGLGTCWLGASFNKSTFEKQLNLKSGERLRIVSPLGYASEKRHISLFLLFGSSKSYQRKPFTANFFYQHFDTPLTEESAGIYAQPLEMVRLAPSATNKQSWRIVMDNQTLHFYKSASHGFDSIDLGIALCHFEQSCHELKIAGHFVVLEKAPQARKASYVISWITE